VVVHQLDKQVCEGGIKFDLSKPDGAPHKLMNVDRLKILGWKYKVDLEQGLTTSYKWFKDNQDIFRRS